jgi:uncharacterized protein
MDNSALIQKTEQFVKQKLGTEGTGHDWWHAVRVINIAKRIHEVEGGDWFIIQIALLLHDVGDRKVIQKDNDDYTIAEDFLIEIGVEKQRMNSIMAIIKTMSYSKSFDEIEKDDSIEFKIVQDADRLDAMGAIGIARAFAFGGSRGRLLYDPTYETQLFTSSDDYKKAKSSTIHHFYEKLFLLKEGLNTDTARIIAEERDEFMHRFVDQFMDEWNGKK